MSACKRMPLQLSVESYEYPADREAINRLNSYSELKRMAKDFIENSAEPWMNSNLTGNSIKVTERLFPHLRRIVEETAQILDVSPPQLFIQQDPFLNAYTHGVGNQNFMVISHSLFEQAPEEYLFFIFGHEMGHIKSQHVLYITVSSWLRQQPKRRRESEEIWNALSEWQRKSEFTADRAGLIACQDIDVALRALLMLTVGSHKIAEQINIYEYIEEHTLALQFNPTANSKEQHQSHPFLPYRMKELISFYHSDDYRKIFDTAMELQSASYRSPKIIRGDIMDKKAQIRSSDEIEIILKDD